MLKPQNWLLLNRLNILLLLSIIIRSAIAQGGFNNYYPSGYLSSSCKIILLDSGKVLVTSYYKDSVTHQQGLDLKHIDLQGNVVLHKRYQLQNMDFGTFYNSGFQCNISSQNILLTGGTYIGTISAVAFLSINKITLDTNWVRSYSNGVFGFNLNTVLKILNNEFWIFGSRSLNANYGTRPYAIKIDTLGNILGFKEFSNLIKYLPRASFYDENTEKIYFTGSNVNNSSDFNTFVVCIDTIGNISWNKEFTTNLFNPFFNKIEKKNNYLVLSGSEGEFMYGGFSQSKLLIAKINASNGSVIWYRKYFDAFFTNYLPSFVINEDESIVAVGSGGFFNPVVDYNNDGIILKVNSAGDSLWMQSYGQYGEGTNEIFYDVIRSSDGGYVMCGLSNNPANLHTWVVKIDSLGNGPGRTTSIKELTEVITDLSFYPNPTNNEITIEFNSQADFTKPKELKIIDVLGREIRTIVLETPKQQVNLRELSKGVYYLQWSSINGVKVTKKLVKE